MRPRHVIISDDASYTNPPIMIRHCTALCAGSKEDGRKGASRWLSDNTWTAGANLWVAPCQGSIKRTSTAWRKMPLTLRKLRLAGEIEEIFSEEICQSGHAGRKVGPLWGSKSLYATLHHILPVYNRYWYNCYTLYNIRRFITHLAFPQAGVDFLKDGDGKCSSFTGSRLSLGCLLYTSDAADE